MNEIKLKQMLQTFLLEDVGEGDLTSQAIFPETKQGIGVLTVKEPGILACMKIINTLYKLLDDSIKVKLYKQDGDQVSSGDTIAEVSGPVVHLLTGERIVLNLLQRMSGIATLTHASVAKLNDSTINICDTRKTTPGLRMLEKYAVRVGGGKNHRYGLYDGVMIKDNHIAFAGSITNAVKAVKQQVGHMVNIEVETETKQEVEEAVKAEADIIMFDNCTPNEIREYIKLVPKHIITEASGGITLEKIDTYAKTGVDYLSLGYLTHSVKALDISLNVLIR